MQRSFPTGSWREQPITQLIQRMAVAPDLTTHTDTNTILRLAQVLAIICEEKPGMMTGAIYKQCKPHVPQMRTPTKSTPSSQPGCAHEFLTHPIATDRGHSNVTTVNGYKGAPRAGYYGTS
eukprot:g33606.t1